MEFVWVDGLVMGEQSGIVGVSDLVMKVSSGACHHGIWLGVV